MKILKKFILILGKKWGIITYLVLLVIIGFFIFNQFQWFVGYRMFKRNPDFIYFFVPEREIPIDTAGLVYNHRKLDMYSLNGKEYGELYRDCQIYENGEEYRLYAWIWRNSIEISPDSVFRVTVEKENFRVASNQSVMGVLNKDATGQVLFINARNSWAFVQLNFTAETTKHINNQKPFFSKSYFPSRNRWNIA